MKLTHDGLLDNRLKLWQPCRASHGYRFNSDSVLLAASVLAQDGQQVLELGCGVGAAALCLLHRLPLVHVVAMEIDSALASLAARNAIENRMSARLRLMVGDATVPPLPHRPMVDHVMLNPPYFDPRRERLGRAAQARFQPWDQPLASWLEPAVARLKQGGTLTLIYPSNRLDEALAAIPAGVGDIVILPLLSKPGIAKRMMVQAVAGGNAHHKTHLPGLLLHEDDGRFTQQAEAILRHGQGLALPASYPRCDDALHQPILNPKP
ncbi:MAG: methyltransferase [Alphaproteobacteria bacterium]|nr:methyltransferase [Alphaproteobacteria bacterium]